MKKIMMSVILIMSILFLSKAENVKVKLKIDNASTKTTSIRIDDKIYTLYLDDSNSAVANIVINKRVLGTFKYKWNKYSVYFIPGKDIEISITSKNRRQIIDIKCDDGGINNYLSELESKEFIKYEETGLKEEQFLQKINSVISDEIKKLKSKRFPSKFTKIQIKNIRYKVNCHLATYPLSYNWITKTTTYKPTSEYYKIIEKLLEENSDLVYLTSYREFAKKAIRTKIERGANYTKIELYTKCSEFASKYKNQNLKEWLMYSYTEGYIYGSGIDDTKELLELFNKNVKDINLIKGVNKRIKRMSKVARGVLPPNFKYKDKNDKIVSLSDLKGKYVYIDFWATWCGACCYELPYLKKLEHKYANKNIIFVSVSCDKNKKRWKEKIRKDELGGIQLNTGGDKNFMRSLFIGAIPRFILLDKEGKLVMVNAPRPSNKNMEKIIDSLRGL